MAQLPQDYYNARANIFTDSKVDTLIRQRGSSPRFVYGPLVLPTVLKYYTDSPKSYPMEKYMTKATLHGYELYQIAEKSVLVIAQSPNPDAVVKGMLVCNLGDSERNDISELEIGLKHLEAVRVEIECKPGKSPEVRRCGYVRVVRVCIWLCIPPPGILPRLSIAPFIGTFDSR